LVCTNIWEPSTYINGANGTMSGRLVVVAAKLSTLGGGVAEEEVELTLNGLLKKPMRSPLLRTSRPSGLLPVTLLPVSRGRRMNIMKMRHALVVILIVVGALVAV